MYIPGYNLYLHKRDITPSEYKESLTLITFWIIVTSIFCSTIIGFINFFYPYFSSETINNLPMQIIAPTYVCAFITANATLVLGYSLVLNTVKRLINANLPPALAVMAAVPFVNIAFIAVLLFLPEKVQSFPYNEDPEQDD